MFVFFKLRIIKEKLKRESAKNVHDNINKYNKLFGKLYSKKLK